MPELPEVETIRLQLKKFLVGHRVESVEVKLRKILVEGEKKIIGAKVTDVRRFGKQLVIDFDNDYSAVMHLKMTGQPIYRGPNLKSHPVLSKKVFGGVPGIHTHVIFNFDQGGRLYFNDYRRFGWIKIIKNAQFTIDNLGPEPLKDLTLEKFKEITGKSKKAIKLLLLDQSKIAGIGNIYANDALWLAKIRPQRPANDLSPTEQKLLYKSILKVLSDGIKYNGASQDAYVTAEGGEGSYQNHFLVYSRERQKCIKCGNKIIKIMFSGRGTYLCPFCQK